MMNGIEKLTLARYLIGAIAATKQRCTRSFVGTAISRDLGKRDGTQIGVWSRPLLSLLIGMAIPTRIAN